MSDGATRESIGLALSGGGVRAAAFHAGVLKYLAEQSRLENVKHISSVSGGSLFVGAVFKSSEYRWPSSKEYIERVFPQIRHLLTSQSLQRAALAKLFMNPRNWRFALSRANVLAQTIEDCWGISVPLDALSPTPLWSINCTTGETGRRFRFKNLTMGDYELGYAKVGSMRLAQAMAISAAFPGGIGPLKISPGNFSWEKRHEWESAQPEPYEVPYKHLHLYDGGLYDNLGIEPLFDVGKQQFKRDEMLREELSFLVVSDGGAPLARQSIPHPLNPFRFKRIADIALDQSHALRVRAFVNFLRENPTAGAFVGAGTHAESTIKQLVKEKEELGARLLERIWLPQKQVQKAATYQTTLNVMSDSDFDLVAQHGHETATLNLELVCFPQKAPTGGGI